MNIRTHCVLNNLADKRRESLLPFRFHPSALIQREPNFHIKNGTRVFSDVGCSLASAFDGEPNLGSTYFNTQPQQSLKDHVLSFSSEKFRLVIVHDAMSVAKLL